MEFYSWISAAASLLSWNFIHGSVLLLSWDFIHGFYVILCVKIIVSCFFGLSSKWRADLEMQVRPGMQAWKCRVLTWKCK
jgi:hypothetical protein